MKLFNLKSIFLNLFISFAIVFYLVDSYYIVSLIFNVEIGNNHLNNILLLILSIFLIFFSLENYLSERYIKLTLYILAGLLILPNIFILGYIIYFNAPLDYQAVMTILATNKDETKEFIDEFFDYRIFITILFSTAIFLPIKFYKLRAKISNKINIPIFILGLLILTFAISKDWCIRNLPYYIVPKLFITAKEDRARTERLVNSKLDQKFRFDNVTSKLSNSDNYTFVLLLGESATNYHHGNYGYKRNTTAYTDKLKDELIIFNDIFSAHMSTNGSLEKILTFADNENGLGMKYKVGDIIDFFKGANFRTYWISNQPLYTVSDSSYSYIGSMADYTYYSNHGGNGSVSKVYDGELLTPLKSILEDNSGRRFIVMHVMGSHIAVINRYPKEFEKFSTSDRKLSEVEIDINAYDNSILYTDYIINEIINLLKNDDSVSYFIYLSDHGEDVYDTSKPNEKRIARRETNPTPPMYKIPFYLWLSERYINQFPEYSKSIRTYINRAYQTDRVIHSIIDLSQLNHKILDTTQSIFSKDFIERKRIIDGKVHNENLSK